MAGTPAIHEFPHDDEVWRIDWLGEVEQTGHEPKVDIHLSHVPYGTESAPGKVPNAKRVIKIGVGQLPYLCTGSMWKNGRRAKIYSQGFPTRRLEEIRFDDGTIQRIPLHHVIGERTGRDGKPQNLWLVPPYAYAIPPELGKTRCFAIEYQGDPYGIVVPSHEVARFYYGQSSDLALAMFRGTLSVAAREVWDLGRCGINQVDGRRLAVIARAKRMANNDCWVLGRILGDKNAERGAHGIYESLLRASANSERPFIDTDIPFRGVASWHARVVKIPSTAGGPPRWLVLEILSCSGAFPFDDLMVLADNDGNPAPDGTPSAGKPEAFPGMHVATHEVPDDELRSDVPPRAGIRQITLLNPAGCYEALRGKTILDPPPKSDTRYRSAESWSTAGGLADMATGEGTYGESGVKPAEVVMDMAGETVSDEGEAEDTAGEKARREALRATFENLTKVVDELDAIEGVTAQIRESKQVARIPLTADPHKAQWSWLESATRRPRTVMVVDVALAGRSASVIEFEQRAGESCMLGVIVVNGQMPLNDAAIVGILRDLAKKRGVWRSVSEPEGARIYSLKHTRTSADKFADAIVGVVKATGL